jgi:hypothetical protein
MGSHHSPAVDGLHPELAVDLANFYVPAENRVPDHLVASQTPVATKNDPLGGSAFVHLLLVRHRLIKPEGLYLAALQLGLDVLQDAQAVLAHARNHRRLWRLRDFPWVLLHAAPGPG